MSEINKKIICKFLLNEIDCEVNIVLYYIFTNILLDENQT